MVETGGMLFVHKVLRPTPQINMLQLRKVTVSYWFCEIMLLFGTKVSVSRNLIFQWSDVSLCETDGTEI